MRHGLRAAAVFGLLALIATSTAHAVTIDSRFDPDDYTSLGTLNATSGNITFNTNALTVTGFAMNGVVAYPQGTSTQVAVFTFDNVSITGSANISVTGTRPLAILSKGSITLGRPINVNGGTGSTLGGSSRAGGYPGGSGFDDEPSGAGASGGSGAPPIGGGGFGGGGGGQLPADGQMGQLLRKAC